MIIPNFDMSVESYVDKLFESPYIYSGWKSMIIWFFLSLSPLLKMFPVTFVCFAIWVNLGQFDLSLNRNPIEGFPGSLRQGSFPFSMYNLRHSRWQAMTVNSRNLLWNHHSSTILRPLFTWYKILQWRSTNAKGAYLDRERTVSSLVVHSCKLIIFL